MRINEQILARHYLYSFFSSAFSDPLHGRFELALSTTARIIADASANLLSDTIDMRTVVRHLDVSREELAQQHQNTFGLTVATKAPAHETEYCRTRDTTYKSQQMADIAGFYEAFRFDVGRFGVPHERSDHLVQELGFMGLLAAKEALANSDENALLCRDASRNFFSAHLGWVPAFAAAVKNEAASGFYVALADSLANFIASEQIFFGIDESRAAVEHPRFCPDAPSAECGGCPCSS